MNFCLLRHLVYGFVVAALANKSSKISIIFKIWYFHFVLIYSKQKANLISKEVIEIDKKDQQFNKEMGNRYEWTVHRKGIQMALRYMKQCTTWLIIQLHWEIVIYLGKDNKMAKWIAQY